MTMAARAGRYRESLETPKPIAANHSGSAAGAPPLRRIFRVR
jgi:hypothetical protein